MPVVNLPDVLIVSLYIRLQLSFWNHRKTLRLKSVIGEAAYWIPPRLWSYAADNQPDGDFSEYEPAELAMLLGYSGNAQAMLEALQAAGFMDEMLIHDWQEHNAYHSVFSRRASEAARARWEKRKEAKEKKQEKKGKEKSKQCLSIAKAFPEGFLEEWEAFRQHRKTIRHPMTEHAEELILARLAERPKEALSALQHAIIHNWRGFEWDWYDSQKQSKNGEVRITYQQRQNRINKLNEKKQQTMRTIKDPNNLPSWAEKELARIDAELKTL